MSLATRCPSCETVFRVVPDQLRVSDGWVRCGRCSEVFNASQHLVDTAAAVELGPPRAPISVRSGVPAAGAGSRVGTPTDIDLSLPEPPAPAATGLPAPEGAVVAGDVDATLSLTPDDIEAELREILARRAASATAPAPAERPDRSLQATPEPAVDDLRADAPMAGAAGTTWPASPTAQGSSGLTPSFVQQADRAARWQRPGMRAALAVALLLALGALAAQVLHTYRDQAAARWPEFRPLLAQGCAWIGCRVEALRAIDALAVESSGLLRVEKSDIYKLSVTLRNQRALEVALPALELSLTDTQGRLIARKVVRASELGAAGATVAPNSDLAMQGSLQVSAATGVGAGTAAPQVAGYTIELFYP